MRRHILPLSSVVIAILLAACGGGGGGAPAATGLNSSAPLAGIAQPVQPAVSDAPYSKVLGDCAFNASRTTSCPLSTLPFLGQDSTTLTVDLIMARVATTHPWMAQRFRESLQSQPVELLQMFRSVTAIIIGAKVRPSFYYGMTGAIYLDPDNLWLTQAEHDTVDKTPDARIDYGKDLQFRAIWRYVKNNSYAYPYYAPSYQGDRPASDTKIPLGRLLAHELAHAGDFAPPSTLASMSRDQTAQAAIEKQSNQWISTRLKAAKPLTSSAWPRLAQVMYADAPPTAEEKSYTPAQAGNLLEPDRAADAYGYLTQYEDLAMLTEELLSYCFYQVQRDLATSNKPASGDFTVGWGVRGRIATPQVLDAVKFAVGELLPGRSFESCYSSLPTPVKMRSGATWTSNLNPSGTGDVPEAKAAVEPRLDDQLPPG